MHVPSISRLDPKILYTFFKGICIFKVYHQFNNDQRLDEPSNSQEILRTRLGPKIYSYLKSYTFFKTVHFRIQSSGMINLDDLTFLDEPSNSQEILVTRLSPKIYSYLKSCKC